MAPKNNLFGKISLVLQFSLLTLGLFVLDTALVLQCQNEMSKNVILLHL